MKYTFLYYTFNIPLKVFFKEGRIISKQNLVQYLETLYLAHTQFFFRPGFYRKTRFLESHPLPLLFSNKKYTCSSITKIKNSIFLNQHISIRFLKIIVEPNLFWDRFSGKQGI